MILDSAFLVDFEREVARRSAGPATRFMQTRSDEELCITFTIAGELAVGESMTRDRAKWKTFIRPFRFLDYNDEIANEDIEFAHKALAEIDKGYAVYYDSWW